MHVINISAARAKQQQQRIDAILAVRAEDFPREQLGFEAGTGHLVATPGSWAYFERVFSAFGLELPKDVDAQAALGATMYLVDDIGGRVALRSEKPADYDGIKKLLSETERDFVEALWSGTTSRVREIAQHLRVLDKRPSDAEKEAQLGPFKGTPLEESMRAFSDQQAALIAELKPLKAGRKNPSPLTAPSLQALRMTKRRGKTLLEAFDDILARKPGAGNESRLAPWGVLPLSYPGTEVAVDLDPAGKAAPILAKALGPGWRAAVARDALALDVKYLIEGTAVGHAWAVFRHPVKV